MTEIKQLVQSISKLPAEQRGSAVKRLINLACDGEFRSEVFVACLNLCMKGVLRGEDFEPYISSILNSWADVLDQARSMQGSAEELEWRIDEDYAEVRSFSGLLLDLMGYLPIEYVEGALSEGLALVDPRLKMFAVLSLLRQSQAVGPLELERIAVSHEVRIVLWEELRKLQMEWLMPEEWSTPAALAASELSRWISDPSELGAPPEEIELMASYPVNYDGIDHDLYLFRFREYPKPWEDGDGWMAGIAGPFRDGEAISSCWSSFESWRSRTAQEHFHKLRSGVGG
jgi:hypothetical protein